MRHSLKNYDITISSNESCGCCNLVRYRISSLYRDHIGSLQKEPEAGLAVLGNIFMGGGIEWVINFVDKVTMLSENGAKSVIVPMDNLNELSSVPPTVLGNTDVPFYQADAKSDTVGRLSTS